MNKKIKLLLSVAAVSMSIAAVAGCDFGGDIKYTVTFMNGENVFVKQEVVENNVAVAPETNPTKDATAQYTYTFDGWYNGETAWDWETVVTENITLEAHYSYVVNNYDVTFVDYNDSVISTQSYAYGSTVVTPNEPSRGADNTYTYAFAGWDKEVVEVVGEATYKATYTPSYIDYVIKFVNEDETLISETNYHYGDTVNAPETPTKASDNENEYTFAGWDKEVSAVSGNETYKATYSSSKREYTVKFVNYDGTELSSTNYNYGNAVVEPTAPTKPADDTYTYTFKGWDKEVSAVAGDVTYTAQYDAVYIDYTITYKKEDGTTLATKTYHKGDAITDIPEVPAKEGHDGAWLGTAYSTMPAQNVEYQASYTANTYAVTLNANGGEVASELTSYTYGVGATLPVATKAGATFDGWYENADFTGESVTAISATDIGAKTYYAKYSASSYTIVFKDHDGTVLQTSTVAYGETPEYKGETPTRAETINGEYEFIGWNTEVVEASGDAEYIASYKFIKHTDFY